MQKKHHLVLKRHTSTCDIYKSMHKLINVKYDPKKKKVKKAIEKIFPKLTFHINEMSRF